MPTFKISNRSVASAEADPDKDTYLWDSELRGFGLKITPAGKKTYLVQYRLNGRTGKTRRVTIGTHGSPWTPDKARQEAKDILGRVGAGEDPAESKTSVRKALTVSQLCDLYMEEGVGLKKASTLEMDRSRINRHIKPLLGDKKAMLVTRADVEKFMHDVAKGKSAIDEKTKPKGRAIVTGGKGVATRTLGLLGSIFNFAVNRSLCKENPVRGIRKFQDNKRERYLSQEEIARLGEVLLQAQEDNQNPYAIYALRLLLVTGCRKNEILTLKWDYVDWKNECLRLPDSKTGARTIRLSAPALAILKEIPSIADNDYVIAGENGKHLIGLQKFWARIRKAAELEDVRLHDLRHTFASIAISAGEAIPIIQALLGHSNIRSTMRYAHLSDDPIRAGVNRVAETIQASFSSKPSAEVRKLRNL